MKQALVIAGNDLLQFLREKQFIISWLVVPVITVGIYSFYMLISNSGPEDRDLISRLLAVLTGVLAAGMSLAMCADSFAGEKERNTLELLLCSPIHLRTLFWGKVLAVLPVSTLLGWMSQSAVLLIASIAGGPSWPMLNIVWILLLTPVSVFFIASISIFISLRAESVRGAAQMSGIFVLIFLFVMQGISGLLFLNLWAAPVLMGFLGTVSVFLILWSRSRFEAVIYTL